MYYKLQGNYGEHREFDELLSSCTFYVWINIWKKGEKNNFLMFWARFVENRFLYTYSATRLGMSKIIYRKNIYEMNCSETNNKLK